MDFLYITRWWILFAALGLLTLPATVILFGRLKDKGYFFSRIIGYLSVSYLMFLTSVIHLLKFTVVSILLCAAVILFIQAVVLYFRRDLANKVLCTLKSRQFWRYVIIEESIFAICLFVWAFLRGCNPNLNDLEKYMNIGFINSMLNTDYMPAADMWAAGLKINYYYFGHFCVSCVTKLSGIASDIAYNLMMATLFAAVFAESFSLSYNLLSFRKKGHEIFSYIGAGLSAILVTLSGNLHYFIYGIMLKITNSLGLTASTYEYWFSDATRYIGYQPPVDTDLTITEFPCYSFVISDLHAHVMNMITVLLFLAVSVCFVQAMYEHRNDGEKSILRTLIPSPYLIVMGCLIGIFSMTNFWDFPIYMVVCLFFFAYTGWIRYGFRLRFWISCIWQEVLLYGLMFLVSLPFTVGFETMFSGIGLVTQRSRFYQLMVLYGAQLLVGLVFAVWVFVFDRKRKKNELPEKTYSKLTLRERFSLFEVTDILVVIFFICGFGLCFGTEFVFVKDIYIDSYPRANTMFKLSYQAFILFALSMGYVFARILDNKRKIWKTCLCGLCLASVFAALLTYPKVAIDTWYVTDGKFQYKGLSGFEFIKDFSEVSYDDGTVGYPEYDAVEWIKENTPKDTVICEAHGESYTDACFVSVATGRQTIIGWETHEWLWRDSYDFCYERQREVDEIYTGTDVEKTKELLEKYGVEYIYVGKIENETYGAENTLNMDKLLSLTDVVFEEYDVKVLKVK